MKKRVLILMLGVLSFVFGAMATQPKPVAVVTGYEKYDLPRLVRRVLAPSGYMWEERGDFLEPSEFGKYSVVIWLSGCKEQFTDDQVAAIRSYLDDGGVFFNTGRGIYEKGIARDFKANPWTGATMWSYHNKNRPTYKFLRAEHPYLQGLNPETDYPWQTAYFTMRIDTNAAVNLIGEGDDSIFSVTPVGKGRLVWLWEGLFRARKWEDPESDISLDRIFLNILTEAKPLEAAEDIRRNSLELKKEPSSLVSWRRDWEFASQDDYVFLPPYARSGERLDSLHFNSAMNELDTQFLLCQSLADQKVTVSITELVKKDGRASYADRISLYIADRPPVVPSLVKEETKHLPDKLGRFMLVPLKGEFEIDSWRPRVLWVQLSTHGLEPGEYTATLVLQGRKTKLSIPIESKVYPVLMPHKRLAELRYWGGGFPNREPFFREVKRQNCLQVTISYPPANGITIRETGQPLRLALRANPEIFTVNNFPDLDFRAAYETNILEALDNGLSNIRLHDVRTGADIAKAGTGEKLSKDLREWPQTARELYTAYFKQLRGYLADKGFDDTYLIWSDEPSWQYIQEGYIPRAKLHQAAGIGSGTHWTAGGFMTPAQVNAFAPYTTDWSMYTIMLPNFLRFVREGSVKLAPGAKVGLTRGASGYALRSSFNRSRTLAWTMVYYGERVNFLRMGPIWKEWLYYVDHNRSPSNRPDGVEGERLLAYGSPDPQDGTVSLLSSSDWESAREGVDDVNLVRMLEWYLDNIKGNALNLRYKRLVKSIRDDMAGWFVDEQKGISATTGFDGEKLTGDADGTEREFVDSNAFDGFVVREKEWDHDRGEHYYRYQSLIPPSTAALEELKRKVLEHLVSLSPYTDGVKGSLSWHDWVLADKGRLLCNLVVPDKAPIELLDEVARLVAHCREISGYEPTVTRSSKWKERAGVVDIVVGTSGEEHIRQLLDSAGWRVDDVYPGRDSYVIKRDRQSGLLLIAAPDSDGAVRGLRNFAVFLQGKGAWLRR